jgi:hypothetical protein
LRLSSRSEIAYTYDNLPGGEAWPDGTPMPVTISTTGVTGSVTFEGSGVLLPCASSAIGFGDIAADAHGLKVHERLIAVIPLVAHDLFDAVALGLHRLDSLGRVNRVSILVVVSPSLPSCNVTPTMAPVSRSTACSALWAKC